MFDIERWQEVFEALHKNKMRTFLTGVSVASGIFILVILLGIGNGLENGIKREFSKNAENRITVWSGTTSKEFKGHNPGRRIQFRYGDFDYISRYYHDEIDKKSPIYTTWSGPVVYGKETGNYRIEGVFPDYQFIENATIEHGRFINENDLKHFNKICIIGMKVKNDLFKDDTEPIGAYLQINGNIYQVVGVFSDPGGERDEARIYLPLTTMQQAYSAGDKIRNMSFTLPPTDNYDEAFALSTFVLEGLKTKLKDIHSVSPDDISAISAYSVVENTKNFLDLNNMIALFFWGVGICTIIAGIVGVGNIMLIIVKERTKEIGIRKALGATPWSIITMILHESIFLTTISGFIGLLTGLALLELVGPQIQSSFFYNPEVDINIAISTLVLLVIAGAVAGFIPANKAARIKPIDALKDV